MEHDRVALTFNHIIIGQIHIFVCTHIYIKNCEQRFFYGYLPLPR